MLNIWLCVCCTMESNKFLKMFSSWICGRDDMHIICGTGSIYSAISLIANEANRFGMQSSCWVVSSLIPFRLCVWHENVLLWLCLLASISIRCHQKTPNHNAHVIMQIVIIKWTGDKMIPANSLALHRGRDNEERQRIACTLKRAWQWNGLSFLTCISCVLLTLIYAARSPSSSSLASVPVHMFL